MPPMQPLKFSEYIRKYTNGPGMCEQFDYQYSYIQWLV